MFQIFRGEHPWSFAKQLQLAMLGESEEVGVRSHTAKITRLVTHLIQPLGLGQHV